MNYSDKFKKLGSSKILVVRPSVSKPVKTGVGIVIPSGNKTVTPIEVSRMKAAVTSALRRKTASGN